MRDPEDTFENYELMIAATLAGQRAFLMVLPKLFDGIANHREEFDVPYAAQLFQEGWEQAWIMNEKLCEALQVTQEKMDEVMKMAQAKGADGVENEIILREVKRASKLSLEDLMNL